MDSVARRIFLACLEVDFELLDRLEFASAFHGIVGFDPETLFVGGSHFGAFRRGWGPREFRLSSIGPAVAENGEYPRLVRDRY